jgi:GDP-L-fucose synthase
MEKTSKILITGASGMVGSALKRLLQREGYNNILSPTRKELDLRQQNAVQQYFAGHKPSHIFHLAAMVGGIHANNTYPADFIYDNTIIHSHVFQAAHACGAKKILFPGSACTYPKLAPQPIAESSFLDGMIEPTNLAYAAAKINGIVMGQSFAKQYGMSVIIPMPTNAYGVGDNFSPNHAHVIPALINRFHAAKLSNQPIVEIWGTGTPMREFLYVDDFASGLLFLMETYYSADIINLGTMQEIPIKDLAHKIALVIGYQGKIVFDESKPDGAPRKCLNSGKLFRMGWQPEVALDEGLRRTYDWYQTAQDIRAA